MIVLSHVPANTGCKPQDKAKPVPRIKQEHTGDHTGGERASAPAPLWQQSSSPSITINPRDWPYMCHKSWDLRLLQTSRGVCEGLPTLRSCMSTLMMPRKLPELSVLRTSEAAM